MAPTPWMNLWSLDPTVVFLNHGSFGACPKVVQAYQQELRSQLEQEPVRFFTQELEPLLDAARQDLANFVGADAQNLVFVPNATTGVNAVLRSLDLKPGDEVLTTNQEYNACRNVLDFAAQARGATVVVAPLPFPIAHPEQVMATVLDHVSPRTRLVLLDHVVSQTALVLPIAPLVQELSKRGIETLIDGAHAPGMIPLNVRELGATYYTGNCHKWLCAPKGAAFLVVQSDRQSLIRPGTISHGANSPRSDRSRFHLEFDWIGTDDPTAWLSVPRAIQYLGSLLPGGWPELMAHNHELVLEARQLLCTALAVPPSAPPEMLGAMATVVLPDSVDIHAVTTKLLTEFRIQVPLMTWFEPPQKLLRVSAQLYNTIADYQKLVEALQTILAL